MPRGHCWQAHAPSQVSDLAQALAGQYRWKMRKAAVGADKVSIDGELDKNNRPFADIGDALGYLTMGDGAHAGLIDFSRTRPGLLKRNRCAYCQTDTIGGKCGCPPDTFAMFS